MQNAIVHGEALADPRLSAAAVEAAHTQLSAGGSRGDVARRVQLVLAVLWVVMGAVLISVSIVTGEWSWNYVLLAINFLAVVVPQAVLRRNLRRAIDVNSRSSAS